jgi:hypothetical protein
VLCREVIGFPPSYQAALVHLELGPNKAIGPSGAAMVISFGPVGVLVNISISRRSGRVAHQFAQKHHILDAIYPVVDNCP